MNRPCRCPDFRSNNYEFWFEPEMIMISNETIKVKLRIINGLVYGKFSAGYMDFWPTVEEAYKANLKRLNNEVDKILLGVDNV